MFPRCAKPLVWISEVEVYSRIREVVFDWLYPPLCLQCDRWTPPDSHYLCVQERADFEFLVPPFCLRCGFSYPTKLPGSRCPYCEKRNLYFSAARSVLHYNSAIRSLLLQWKLGRISNLEYPLSDLLVELVCKLGWEKSIDLISYVPLHPVKLRQRGFNQAQALATQLSRQLAKPVRSTLIRTRATKVQASVENLSRWANVAEVFAPDIRNYVNGKNLLLVDDVMTSGATVSACAKILKHMGAKKIWVATVARGGMMLSKSAI